MRSIDIRSYERRVIGDILRDQAEQVGDDAFLLMDDRVLTYHEANSLVNRYANGFAGRGVQAGDVVALFMENSLEFVLSALAVNKLGAAWAPTNTAYGGQWLEATLEDGGARVLVVDSALLPRLGALGETARQFETIVVANGHGDADGPSGPNLVPLADLATACDGEPLVEVLPRELSAVTWTSGTTGRSKGVMQLHSTWTTIADYTNRARDLQEGDRFYCCLPLYTAGAWGLHVFSALVSGLAVAIDQRFSVGEFWNRVHHYGATQIFTLGAMHMFLWQAEPHPRSADNPVRVAGCVPMPGHLVGPFKERFGIAHIWQGFGQSEATPYSITLPGQSYKDNSCGRVRDDLEVRLLDDNDVEVPVGEPGEVCIRPRDPDLIFAGYFNRPADTVAAWRNLWYHTGDIGRLDQDGELFFVDRKADFVRYGGRNISSFEVEGVIAAHPDVVEVGAHGVRSQELEDEEELKVCVVCRPGAELTPEELARFVNEHAPYFFVPRYIEFVEELPHTPTGKVQKYLLRQRGVTAATWDRSIAKFEVKR